MLHTINPEILFLKQEDVIKAGLLDMKEILAVTEKTYAMLGQGLIKNPPKTNTSIPDKENWQSFFNAMPCYIGGDINIGGIKWAAESKKNATIPGIPYGIDISILSDPETVLPFCILDGTLNRDAHLRRRRPDGQVCRPLRCGHRVPCRRGRYRPHDDLRRARGAAPDQDHVPLRH